MREERIRVQRCRSGNGTLCSCGFIAVVLTGVLSLVSPGCAGEATAEKSQSKEKNETAEQSQSNGMVASEGRTSTPAVAPSAAAKIARSGHDWPRFLGPSGFGHSTETGLLKKWPENGPPLIWKKKVGKGYSAPSVRGNRLVLHHRIGNEEIIDCLKADTGERLWRHKYPSHFSDPYQYSNGPRCSPLLTKDRCYTYGAEGKLVCLNLLSGKRLWQRDCLKEFNLINKTTLKPNWFFGVGCSPILEGDLLIVMVGGQPNSGVVAFEAKSGKTVWQNVGQKTWDGVETGPSGSPKYQWTGNEQIVSYSSPIAVTIHNKRHVLCFGRQGLVSLDPKTGKVNFKHWFRSRSYESVNAARPLVVDDKIFLSVAYRQGSTLLQVGKDGKSYKVLWRDRRNMLTHWSTAIHVDGYIYGFSGRHEREGSFRCLDIKTGKVQWATSGFEGNLNDFAQNPATGAITNKKTGKDIPWPFLGRGSKIRVGDKFIVLGERGTLSLVKINPKKFEEISRTSYKQINWPAWTAPVLSRKRLYLRDDNALICLDLAPPAKKGSAK